MDWSTALVEDGKSGGETAEEFLQIGRERNGNDNWYKLRLTQMLEWDRGAPRVCEELATVEVIMPLSFSQATVFTPLPRATRLLLLTMKLSPSSQSDSHIEAMRKSDLAMGELG